MDKEKKDTKKSTAKKTTTVAAKKKTAAKKVDTGVKTSIDEKVKKEILKEEAPKTENTKVVTTKTTEIKKEAVNKLDMDTFDKNLIIAFIVGVLVTLIIVYALKLGTPAKLENGEEIIVTYGDEEYTADEYYKDLKSSNGIEALVTKIDSNLYEANGEYTDELVEEVSTQIEYLKTQYGDNFVAFIQQYGFNSENDLYEYFLTGYVQQGIVEEYITANITDAEVKEYYDNKIKGDLEVSHILITPVTTDEMTEEETAAAKEAAKAEANEIITKLNNGEDFAELAKTYSDDTGTKENGGLLPKFNSYLNVDESGNEYMMVDEFNEASYALEVDKYSTTPVETEYGYHIILKHSESEKPAMEDLTDTIKNLIYTDKLTNDSTIGYEALDKYRKDNGMEFKDSVLKGQYETYLNSLLNSSTSS